MKKKFLLILLTVFMVFALAACGGETDDDDDDDDGRRKKRTEQSSDDDDRDKDDDDDDDRDKDDDKDKDADKDRDDDKDKDADKDRDDDKDKDADKDRDDDKDKDAEKDKDVPVISSGTQTGELVGTWALEYDGSEELSAQLGSEVTFVFTILMDFNEDGTMKMYINPDAFKEEVNTSLLPVMVDMVYAQMAEMGLGDDKQAVEDAFITAYGKGVKEFCEETLAESLDDLSDSFNSTGSYKTEGNKLYMTDDDGSLSDYIIFSVDGDTLTLDDPNGAKEVDGLKLPLVLKRQ